MFIEPDPQLIKQNFGRISKTYDAANDTMSLGLLRLWRQKLIRWSGVSEGQSVLDVATGTGDLAFLFQKEVGADGRVVGLDLTPEMLEVAKQKAELRQAKTIDWIEGDSMNLPFADNTFDVATISYGVRNVKDPQKAISELVRVTRAGGVVLVLETGAPQNLVWNAAYGFIFRHVLTFIGGLTSRGNFGPYRFLQKSSMAFPSGSQFVDWMKISGNFKVVEFKPLLGGVSYLYKGVVAPS